MIFFRYTMFLEKENEYLKQRVESLEARNQELVFALIPNQKITPITAKENIHTILSNDHGIKVTCACGWTASSDDPGVLQQEISSHFQQTVVSRGRKSWSQVKNILETEAERKSK